VKTGPINIGIIGAGNVLEAYMPQCDKLASKGKARVVAVCGRENQRQRAIALGAGRFTTTEAEILENREVDLLMVLASMPEHARLVRAGLNAGKHVLVEKPLATNLQEAGELLKLARSVRRELVSAPFTVLSPTFQTMAARVARGDIGTPCLARGRYGWSGPWWSEWFYKKGGGCLFDLGVYPITTLTGLLGPVKRVSAMMGVCIQEREINGQRVKVEAEDNAQITLDFGNNTFANVMSGFTMQQYRNPAIEIYGTTGVIQMLGDDWDPDGYELWQNAAGCWQVFKETQPEWSWAEGLRHTVECLLEGKGPLVQPEHAYHVLEVMLIAQEAARTGTTLKLESSFEQGRFEIDIAGEPAHLMHDRSRDHLKETQ
jgi:predicted dehydrogenase